MHVVSIGSICKVSTESESLVICDKIGSLREQAGLDKWIVCSLVDLAARDRISLLLKFSIHCCLPFAACMRDVQKAGLLYTPLLVEKVGVAPDVTLGFITRK